MALNLRSFKNNFTSGELTPTLQGRADLDVYKNGALTMENALPRPQGGFRRRGGVRYVARKKFATAVRLIPFRYSVTQTYVLEIGNLYMRFYTNQGRLEETASTVSGTADVAGKIRITTAAVHGLTTGDPVAVRNVMGTVEANNDWIVTVIDTTTIELDNSSHTNAWVSGGTVNKIVEVAAPWATADLSTIRYAQDTDQMILVHPDYWPYLLERVDATTFTLTKIDNVLDAAEERWLEGPFGDLNQTLTTVTSNASTGTVTLTASDPIFTADHVGMWFRIGTETGGDQGVVRLTVFTDTTHMNGAVESTLANFTATVNWAFGAFGDAVGFPVAAAFHEQRLVFLKDNYVHGSKIGDFFDFHIGTDADEPYSFGIAATELNIGRWLASHDVLLVGTEGAEYAIRGVSDAAISPTSIRIKEQSAFGSDTQPALKIGQTLLYVQRGGRRVYDLAFDLDNNKYLSSDLTLIANHIFADDPIRDSAFQLNPDPVAWFVSDGGVLVSLTIIKSQDVISWARHIVTGTTVEAVAVIPLSTADNDDVWIAGDEFIGYLDDTLYVDWGLSETFASASTSISGIDHLEGETVTINGDGAVYTDRTVTDGAITIADTEAPITTIQVGRSFTPTVVPVSPEFQLPTGPSFGAKKRFTRLLVFAVDTMTLQLNGEQVAPRDPEDLMDAAPTIEAEEIFQFTSLGAAEIVRLSIQQPLPLAMDVTSLYGEVEIE